jgi:hypothetical protein
MNKGYNFPRSDLVTHIKHLFQLILFVSIKSIKKERKTIGTAKPILAPSWGGIDSLTPALSLVST